MRIATLPVPAEMMLVLKDAGATLIGNCFENCVIAVLALHASNELKYFLGFLTPPDRKAVAHAWLRHDGDDGPIYLDPTLQAISTLWNRKRQEFQSDERFCYPKEQLVKYFKAKYPDRKFSESGIPSRRVTGPTITDAGRLQYGKRSRSTEDPRSTQARRKRAVAQRESGAVLAPLAKGCYLTAPADKTRSIHQ